MKKYVFLAVPAVLAFLFVLTVASRRPLPLATPLSGAWELEGSSGKEVVMFTDKYYMYSNFDKATRKLNQTFGGTYEVTNGQLKATQEFNLEQGSMVGHEMSMPVRIENDRMTITVNDQTLQWRRIDKGTGPLAGVWRSGGRMQDGKVTFSPLGARKTFKMLSGTRFQWTAMNTETKQILGTGGGTYTYQNGKYTENLEFFSRDSSRVGMSLVFDGKVENNNWFHSGLNSRGQQMNEIWGKVEL